MPAERFKEQDENSFFGRFVHDPLIPRDHFLRLLLEIVPWRRFTYKLVKLYKGAAKEGRPPYDPAVVLRMLPISYLYGLSQRQTELMVNDSFSFKFFLGLALDEKAPDHSTWTAFKARLIANRRGEKLQELLAEIIKIAKEKGIQLGTIQVMDSVHTVAHVNTGKDQKRQKEGKAPRDPDGPVGGEGHAAGTDEGGGEGRGVGCVLRVQGPYEPEQCQQDDHQRGGDWRECLRRALAAEASGGRYGEGPSGGSGECGSWVRRW